MSISQSLVYLAEAEAIQGAFPALKTLNPEVKLPITELHRLQDILQVIDSLPDEAGAMTSAKQELSKLFSASLRSGVLIQPAKWGVPNDGWYKPDAPVQDLYVSFTGKEAEYGYTGGSVHSVTSLSLDLFRHEETHGFLLQFAVQFDRDHTFFGMTNNVFEGELNCHPVEGDRGYLFLNDHIGFVMNDKVLGSRVAYALSKDSHLDWELDGVVRFTDQIEDL